ncbi:MAG: FemAB family PEP-CTERM system-associated protein [Gammaproteobacteria bacterium]|nr:FemAB family PEP-CTERM system-associated protein [Gammaproteobacteria bacterium]
MSTLAAQLALVPRIDVASADQAAEELDGFVQGHARGSIYHLNGWRRLAAVLFGHEAFCLMARKETGELTGILPLVRLKSRLFGNYMVSMPYVNYGGALADDPRVEETLMCAAAELAGLKGCSHVEFRDTFPRGPEWALRTDKVAMVLALPETGRALWSAIGGKCRAQVRRPMREGADVLHGGRELLTEFYAVFARNMRDLGTPVYPRRFFAQVMDMMGEAASISVVRLGGRPVAAALLLRDRLRMEVPWASSLRASNALGTNMLLYWSLLERAVEAGCTEFDFGRSSVGSGTWRFKKQWGAEERQLYWHYWLAPGQSVPALNPANPRYGLAVAFWKRLPLPFANLLGPHIVKSLP